MGVKAAVLNKMFKLNIVSDLPGRLRLKVTNFNKIPKEAQEYQKYAIDGMKKLDGIKEVNFNFVTGSILIKYDIEKLNSKKIISWLDAIKKWALNNEKEIRSWEGKSEQEIVDMVFNLLDNFDSTK